MLGFASLMSLSSLTLVFSPPIINDYINQLEALKKDEQRDKKEIYDILDKYNSVDKQLNESLLNTVDFSNSWLLNCIGHYCNIEKEYPKAIEWYMKSANLGNSYAMTNLGYYYKNIEKDYPKAIEWYIKSANLGNSLAIYNLKIINLKEELYDYIFNLMIKCEQGEIQNILLNKLPKEYINSKYQEIINNLKSVKTQGIDKVLINSILKHY